MSDMIQQPDRPPAPLVSNCPYCGAALDPAYYFCRSCATPFQADESVTPRYRPLVLTDGQLIQRDAPHAFSLFWTYAIVLLALMVLSQAAFRDNRGAYMLLADSVLIVMTAVFAYRHWESLRVQFSRFGFDRAWGWICLALLIPVLALNMGYHQALRSLIGEEGRSLMQEMQGYGLSHAMIIVLVAAVPALTEEIAFRGLLQHWLQVAISPMKAVVLASFLFAVLHGNLIGLPILFAVGFLLGWAKLKTGSLYPSMLIHFLHNLIVLELS